MKTPVTSPQRHRTAGQRDVYLLSIEAFPSFFANVYLIDDGNGLTLVDTASGMDASNEALIAGITSLDVEFGLKVSLADVRTVLVTHGHMDHFGGVAFVRSHTDAPVGVHPLDQRVLSRFEERVVMASQQLSLFLERCGLSPEKQKGLMSMYHAPKLRYSSVPVDFLLQPKEPVIVPGAASGNDLELEVIHVPGHSPGLVCLRVDDVLLTADHILGRTTPHQAPESITLNMGLQHYFASLEVIEQRGDIRLGLGGHEHPIEDVPARAREIRASHERRLEQVLDLCAEPRTIAEVSKGLFGALVGYNVLLGIEEAGAHVEYLHQLGQLTVSNIGELEQGEVVARYIRD